MQRIAGYLDTMITECANEEQKAAVRAFKGAFQDLCKLQCDMCGGLGHTMKVCQTDIYLKKTFTDKKRKWLYGRTKSIIAASKKKTFSERFPKIGAIVAQPAQQ